MSLFDALVKHGMPLVPKPIVGRVARRYVAGESLDDAVRALRAMNDEGAMGTVDVLGEEIQEISKADQPLIYQAVDRTLAKPQLIPESYF